MVSSTTRAANGFSPDSSSNPDALVRPIWQTTPPDDNRATTTSRFQARLHNFWHQDGAEAQTQPTRVLGEDGIAGALNGKLIPF